MTSSRHDILTLELIPLLSALWASFMQPYDLVMLAILLGATAFGAWKGMAWQIASLASLVVSYFVALRFSESLAPYISSEVPWNKFLAMLLLYLGTSLAIWIAFRYVSTAIDRVFASITCET